MFEEQEEGGGRGLGLFGGRVMHIPKTLKTPHMGWSLATTVRSSPIGPVGQTDFYYFVHSYAVDGAEPGCVVATTSYGVTFPSVVISENLWACQFHPEKSSAAGIRYPWAFRRLRGAERTPISGGRDRVIIFPAIDIRGGACVRLIEGDYDQETVFDEDPVEAAKRWFDSGASHIHVVDLDGAKDGVPANSEAIRRIREAVPCYLQVGGGIRTQSAAADLLEAGIDRIVVGSLVLSDRHLSRRWPPDGRRELR